MSLAAKIGPAPRYGSVVQMATYAGLSPKTIRRLIESGKVRGLKVGRRLLIPFEDLDRHILRIEDHRPRTEEVPAMASATTTVSPHRSVDARGRALPMTAEEVRVRNAEAIRALDDVAAMGDVEEQNATFEALKAAIDEDPLSSRRRFR